MAYRLTKITTRTGDDGTTGLGDGSRVSKSELRVDALGDVDELNCAIGLVRTEPIADYIETKLETTQNTLFDLGGELCIPTHRMLRESQIIQLDEWISEFNTGLQPLKEFVLPGGCRGAAFAHLARAACRRAERRCVALAHHEDVSEFAIMYLNRLSDFLFVTARVLNHNASTPDVLWQRNP
ncbi:MAG: cob(I)yrinic acid a,c-diamide adenosyltransferase [Betaproteobacteria bacterium]|nr:cob(I)yrinic acid a,c-diamide adenosyltransferase [Betaproteobacteria bacterium]